MRILALIADRVFPVVTGTRVRNRFLWPAIAELGPDLELLGLDLQRASDRPAEGPPGIAAEFVRPKRQPAWRRAIQVPLVTHHQWPPAPDFAAVVDRRIAEWKPDIVHAEELRMAAFLPRARGKSCSALQTLTLHNVESDLMRRTGSTQLGIATALFGPIRRASLKRFERRAVHTADLALAYSETDLARYLELYPATRWHVTRNGTDVRGVQVVDPPDEPRVLLVGSLGYAPNINGLHWFIERVLPALPVEIGVTVAGSHASAELRQRIAAIPRIRFVDTPAELAPLYESHGLCAIPLLDGSGTRGRILEALAYRRLVVTTAKGAEGLNLGGDSGVVIQDEPAAFAAAIAKWARPSAERQALAELGRKNVMAKYDWSVVAAELLQSFERCASH